MKASANKQRLLIAALILITLTTAVYWPVVRHGFIDYDDPDYVTQNEVVQRGITTEGVRWAFTTGHASNWHPLTWLSHMLDVSSFGMNPAGHHATNLALHVANTIVLLLLLHQLTGAVWRGAFVAALFALHPLHVESVAWVAERKDVLSTFLGLLCLMAYGAYAQSKVEGRRSNAAYALAFVLLALGLMSKPMLVTWPFVMLLLDFWPLRRVELSSLNPQLLTLKQLVLEKLPFLALVVGSSILTVSVQQSGGAVSSGGNLPIGDRVENAIASYLRYLGKTLWPTDLAIYYPHPELRYPFSEQWPLGVIALAALLLVVISILTARQWRRQPYLGVGWFWYLGTLLPVIGLVQVGTQAMADRYSYVPLIGIFIAVTWGITELLREHRTWLGLAALVIVACCTRQTHQQVKVWRNDFTVFENALKATPNNHVAHSILGKAYAREGRNDAALAHFQAALQANPNHADANHDLGLLFLSATNYSAAIEHFQKQLRVRPGYPRSYIGLGAAYYALGNDDLALDNYQEALRLAPNIAEANLGMGVVLMAKGQFNEAAGYLSAALRLRPGLPKAEQQLGQAFALLGRFEEAEMILRRATADESDSRLQAVFGYVLAKHSQTQEANEYIAAALAREPSLPEQFLQEGQSHLAQGQIQSATAFFEIAMYLRPDSAEIQSQLGSVLAAQGRLAEAKTHLEQAIALQPTAQGFYHLAVLNVLEGNVLPAVTHLEQAIELNANWPVALNELAWILATHPNAQVRNGPRAQALAERACQLDGQEPRYWGTLDAAYAETGQFEVAIRTAEKVRTMAAAAGQAEIAKAADERLVLYKQRQPYRQPAR